MRVALVSTYELGRQPFGLASPAAWLAARGHEIVCVDLCLEKLSAEIIHEAELIAFYLPMHTATRLAVKAIERVRELNPRVHLCCYGLYAPLNETYLRSLGVETILGGEFEAGLSDLADCLKSGSIDRPQTEPIVSLERQQFVVPDRSSLPPLASYAKLRVNGSSRIAGYTEASRGCKHRCRHCPIVPVYDGRFRVVQAEIVLEDIRRQAAAGAAHITFGDPDFFNGPAHATRIVETLHQEFPSLTYDATIKIEHLRKHRDLLPMLKRTGCLFVTSAVESVDDAILEKLEKGHTREDFIETAGEFRKLGLTLAPTFIPFTPWTTLTGYRDLLSTLVQLNMIEHVSPIQLALRLLIPAGSRLLELDDVRAVVTGYDQAALLHRWQHGDPAIDALAAKAMRIASGKGSRRELFGQFWLLVHDVPFSPPLDLLPRAAIPYMDEPWYC